MIRWPDEGSAFNEPEEPDIPPKELDDAQQERDEIEATTAQLLAQVHPTQLAGCLPAAD